MQFEDRHCGRVGRWEADGSQQVLELVARPHWRCRAITDLRREAARDLAATLGEERLRQLRAEGDSVGTDVAVAAALDVIQQIPLP